MKQTEYTAAEHQDIGELLPWFVNGRLSDADRQRVDSHLRLCEVCRDELAAQHRIYREMSADAGVEHMPMAGLNRLRLRIENLEDAGTARAAPEEASRSGAPAGSANYYTVTTAAAQPANTAIRAVFAPTVTLSELQELLDDAHLKIVSGPTEAGVYSLAMSASPSVDWSLRRLRGHETVRFAESVVPASATGQGQ